MTQRLRKDLRVCGKVGPYARQDGRNISFPRPEYSDPEVCRRYCRPTSLGQRSVSPHEEGEGVRYRAASGVYDRHGADDRHRPYRVDDRRRSKDSGNDKRVEKRSGRRERHSNLHGIVDDNDKNSTIDTQREPAQCLWDLTGLGYHELMSKLEDRFETRGHEKSYRHKLHAFHMKPGEFFGDLAKSQDRWLVFLTGPIFRSWNQNIKPEGRKLYSDPEVCRRYCRPTRFGKESDRPREESQGVRYRAAPGGVYDCHGADDQHRSYRVDDRRRSEDSGDDERVDGRSGKRERRGNIHGVNGDDENST
ncbi:hypothetical protein HELRODRAFT_184210 [Helobdella robusta]|uniref:Uncharacterized protein n=1 Tax=Helobdella robusta TaxID=6412 RepID=T1FKR8_HELRO|nr:hypothetical protein HELRODRAFT_184210 [Helobdella robusta]ESO05145.1 hypothetical protein HELRODRAFT_184210 [Helobdella robusta]